MKSEIGKRYGMLTVLEFDHVSKSHNAYWKCMCDCGMVTVVNGSYLRSGHTRSCGCLKAPYPFTQKKHGYSDAERLYGVWEQMRSRCNNPNNPRYNTYGAKGIKLCDEWNDYGVFRKWAYENGYKESDKDTPRRDRMSIDRIDPKEGYSPDNCRWITLSANVRHMLECQANQR